MSALGHKRTFCHSLDHLVSDGEHARRNGEAERFGSREVDDELEFGRLQHRQVGGLCALEDATAIDADLMKHVRDVGSIAHQPAGFHKFTEPISRRNSVARRQGDKLHAAAEEKCVGSDEEGVGALARKVGKSRVYLADRTDVEDLDLQSDGGGGLLHLPQRGLGGRSIGRIDKHGNTNSFGHEFMQEPQPLGQHLAGEKN